jgi:hypothetical protein
MRASTVVATPLANLAQDHDVMLVWSIDGSLDLSEEETVNDEAPQGAGTGDGVAAESGGNG